jgi:hypothetical protein
MEVGQAKDVSIRLPSTFDIPCSMFVILFSASGRNIEYRTRNVEVQRKAISGQTSAVSFFSSS